MDVVLFVFATIGAISGAIAIWDFVSVQYKSWKVSRPARFPKNDPKRIPPASYEAGSGYRMPRSDDLKKGAWAHFYDGKTLPFITYGNFFGDGNLAEAYIVISNDEKHGRILVLNRGTGKVINLTNDVVGPFGVMLTTVPAGKYKSRWEKMGLELTTHAIEVTYLETSAFIYYWDEVAGTFREYCTAD